MPEVYFELPDPALAQYTWILSDEHTPVASPPLTSELFGGMGRGTDDGVPRSLRINGFTYTRHGTRTGGPPVRSGSLPQSVEEMRSWRTDWQPEVDKVVEALRQFDPSLVKPGAWQQTVDQQQSEYWRVFGPVHRYAVMPAHAVAGRFQDAYVELFGEERRADARALLQGFPNASLRRASMLWDLSRLARERPQVLEATGPGRDPADTDAGREFQAGFRALLVEFGDTSEGFLEDQPNWSEDSSAPLAAIRAYAGLPDGRGPADSASRQSERREELEAELRRRAGTDKRAADLLALLPIAQELLPNLEDHNYYTDQRLTAASRSRWLAIGRHILALGAVHQADDVFYFHRPELIAVLDGQTGLSRAELARRRRDLAAWRSVSPPPVLGRPLAASEEPFPGIVSASEVRVLRGVAASPGTYRGRARVIDSIAEAATLQPGDVLVARVTTPAWTPFFGVASALVINVGGALSHASVVAREFGLPAVVGTVNGTAQIVDGATVTVDGTNGVVLIEE